MPTRGRRAFQVANAVVLTGVVLLTLFPIANVIARSFSNRLAIASGQVGIWPKGFTLAPYRSVVHDSLFWTGYRNTLMYTAVSLTVSMVLTTCYAYVLSKKHLRGRRFLVTVAVVTMVFNGGLIPNYLVVSGLGLRNTIWAVALPNAIDVFNLLVMKAYFESLPVELEEAGAVDGMGTYRVLWHVVLPLSKPVLASIALFYGVFFWNSWFEAFLYMDRLNLFPVSVYLRNLLDGAPPNIQAMGDVLTAAPLVLVCPLLQRYLVSGVMLGAVKQ